MKEELFGKTIPATIKDPFNSEFIESIHMRAVKRLFDKGFKFSGSVNFKNNNTEGTQNFEADSLGELYVKIQNFCLMLR